LNCGEAIAPSSNELRAVSAPGKRRKRFLWWSAAAVLVIGISSLAWLNHDLWVIKLPTSVLLGLADQSGGEIKSELRRRLEAGEVDADQFEDVLFLNIHELAIDVRTPFAANTEQYAQIACRTTLVEDNWSVRLENLRTKVDGAMVSQSKVTDEKPEGPRQPRKHVVRIPALNKGEHDLEVIADVVIKDRRNSDAEAGEVRRTVSAQKDITIKGDIGEYITWESNEDQCRQIGAILEARLVCRNPGDMPSHLLVIGESLLPIQLVSGVWVKLDNSADYVRVGDFRNKCIPGRVILDGHSYNLDAVPGIKKARRIDVRIIPDRQLAIQDWHEKCFGGVIEWEKLYIRRPRPGVNVPRLTRTQSLIRIEEAKSDPT
jgi:hypothetical protein